MAFMLKSSELRRLSAPWVKALAPLLAIELPLTLSVSSPDSAAAWAIAFCALVADVVPAQIQLAHGF